MKTCMKKQRKGEKAFLWKSILLLGLFITLCGFAPSKKEEVTESLLAIILVALLLPLFGFGLGSFGLLVNNIFGKRTAMAYQVLRLKPGLSFLMGIIITIVAMGILSLFQAFPGAQGLIFLAYVLGLLLVAIAVTVRLVARFVEPAILADDLPGPWSHIKAGVFLLAIHLVLFLGSFLFFCVLLACVGATLLSYFASVGKTVTPGKEGA